MSYQQVILSLGARFLSAGFAGNPAPTVVRRTNRYDLSGIVNHSKDALCPYTDQMLWDYSSTYCDLTQLEFVLEKIIYDILTQQLLVDPKRCKLTFIEPLFLPVPYKDIITRVCLFHLHCVSLRFVPRAVMTCIGSGSRCGLVVDLGWTQSTVTPVYDLRILYRDARSSIRSGSLIHEEVYLSFKKQGNIPLHFEFIERFIMETCYCRTKRVVEGDDERVFSFDGIEIPNRFRYEAIEKCLFGELLEIDDDNRTVVNLLDTIIDKLPLDLRGELPSRILFTGVYSEIPGVKAAVLDYLSDSRYPIKALLTLGSWKGASLYLSTATTGSHAKNRPAEIHRDKYLNGDELMVDWTDSLYQM